MTEEQKQAINSSMFMNGGNTNEEKSFYLLGATSPTYIQRGGSGGYD